MSTSIEKVETGSLLTSLNGFSATAVKRSRPVSRYGIGRYGWRSGIGIMNCGAMTGTAIRCIFMPGAGGGGGGGGGGAATSAWDMAWTLCAGAA